MSLDREARPQLSTTETQQPFTSEVSDRPARRSSGGIQFSSSGPIPAVSKGETGAESLSASEAGFAATPASFAAKPKLPPTERNLLIRETDNNLNSAYVAYSNATHNVRAQLKEAADDSNELVLALLEVGLGLAVPGLGRLASASIKALSGAPKAAELVSRIVSAPEFGGIVTGVTKAASMAVKPTLPAARQYSTDEGFLQALQKSFGDAKADIQGQLPGMSDEAIAAVCTQFDRANANEEIYGTAVNRMVTLMRDLKGTFQSHSKRFGGGARSEMERYDWTETDLIVNVGDHDDYQNNDLVICEEIRGGAPSQPDGYHFKRRIPPEMRATAIEMAWKRAGHPPHFVHRADMRVGNVPGARF